LLGGPHLFVTWGVPPTIWQKLLLDFDKVGLPPFATSLFFAFLEWITSTPDMDDSERYDAALERAKQFRR
jgi:hypothetical protein